VLSARFERSVARQKTLKHRIRARNIIFTKLVILEKYIFWRVQAMEEFRNQSY
jgi:hypothetical protein